MSKVVLTYRFTFPDSRERVFRAGNGSRYRGAHARRRDRHAAALDAAGVQSVQQLSARGRARCRIVRRRCICPSVIDGFADLVSYDKVRVTVESEERSVVATLSAQQALASLMGLIMASSGCPRTAVFRPMARFHLPFSSESETAYRVAAMYLLAQHFIASRRRQAGSRARRSRARLSRRACSEPRHGAASARSESTGCDRQCNRAAGRVQQPRAGRDPRHPRRAQACVRSVAVRVCDTVKAAS